MADVGIELAAMAASASIRQSIRMILDNFINNQQTLTTVVRIVGQRLLNLDKKRDGARSPARTGA